MLLTNDGADLDTHQGLGDQVEFYEMYFTKKYGPGSKDLTPGEISGQFITLSRCKRDAKMLKQLTDYFAALENYRRGVDRDKLGEAPESRASPTNPTDLWLKFA